VIKIASANGGSDGAVRRAVTRHSEVPSPPRPCVDHVPLCDWTARVPASAPLLPATTDMVVCLGTCGYQTTTTTTSTVVPPPSYNDSVRRYVLHQPAPPQPSLRPTYYHRQYPDAGHGELLTSRGAAQLNFYTNHRT